MPSYLACPKCGKVVWQQKPKPAKPAKGGKP